MSANNLILNSTEERALTLLGKGVNAAQTASALGITESAVSQLLANPDFAEKVSELRYKNLLTHSERDEKVDNLEDKLLRKLSSLAEYVVRPMEAARMFQIVNAAKRRGQSAPESITNSAEVVTLVMPVAIINKFEVNSANQVVQAGNQPLITVQSGNMQKLLTQHKEKQNVPLLPSGNPATSNGS